MPDVWSLWLMVMIVLAFAATTMGAVFGLLAVYDRCSHGVLRWFFVGGSCVVLLPAWVYALMAGCLVVGSALDLP